MDKKNTTIIICCAGMGTRLGIGTPKALLNINNKPLIIHQLELLKDFEDIRIVVGFQADKVIETVKKYRKDIMFVFNYDFENTGPAASLSKAMKNSRKYIISMDGDVLIKSYDFEKFINYKEECLVVTEEKSDEAIFVDVENNKAIQFNLNNRYIWSGIVKIESQRLKNRNDYIYKMIEPLLPLPIINLRTKEVNTQEDYERLVDWLNINDKN